MGPTTLEIAIDAPAERVFAVLSDLSLRSSFTDHFQKEFRLTRLEPRGVGAGARFRTAPPGAGDVWSEFSIAEAKSPRLLKEEGRSGRLGRVAVFTTWEIARGSGGGPRSEVRLSFGSEPANALDRLHERLGGARWYERRWKQALKRLAELAEADPMAPALDVAGGDRAWTGVF